MRVPIQLTVDCRDPQRLVDFWSQALGYTVQPPPGGAASWAEHWRAIGLPEEEVVDSGGALVDPEEAGPRIWFQEVPEAKVVKNRLHLDLEVSGGRAVPLEDRRTRVLAAAERLEGLGATRLRVLSQDGLDHFAVVLTDPEGNEFCLH